MLNVILEGRPPICHWYCGKGHLKASCPEYLQQHEKAREGEEKSKTENEIGEEVVERGEADDEVAVNKDTEVAADEDIGNENSRKRERVVTPQK